MNWMQVLDSRRGGRGQVYLNGKPVDKVFRVVRFGPVGWCEQAVTDANGYIRVKGDEIVSRRRFGFIRIEPLP